MLREQNKINIDNYINSQNEVRSLKYIILMFSGETTDTDINNDNALSEYPGPGTGIINYPSTNEYISVDRHGYEYSIDESGNEYVIL